MGLVLIKERRILFSEFALSKSQYLYNNRAEYGYELRTPEALSFRRSSGGMTGLCLMFSLPSFFWTFGIEHFIRRLKGFAFCYFHASMVWRVVKENLSIAFLMVSNEEP